MKDKFRCHFSIVFENLGASFWVMAVAVFTQLDNVDELITNMQNDFKIVLIVLAVIVGILTIIFLYCVNMWRKTWISIEEDAIVIERKTMFKVKNTIGIQNISNINLEQNILERIIGTYKIKMDTNSKTTADKTDVRIVLSKEMAMKFKEEVMLRMNGNHTETLESTETGKIEYDVTYSPKEIFLHCCYTAGVFAVLMLITMIIGTIVGLRSIRTGAVLVDGLMKAFGGFVALVLIAGSVIQSLVKDFFVYYGFGAKRKGNKIYIHHGLFKTREYALSVDKINAIQIVSPTVSRILGRQYVKVICVGVGDEKNENSMILLSETKEDMKEKLEKLLPEFLIEEPKLVRREKNTLFSELPRLLYYTIIFALIAGLFGFADVLDIPMIARVLIITGCILVGSLIYLASFLKFKTCGIYVGEKVLTVCNGYFVKFVTSVPYHKIQQMEYQQGLICRHFGYAKGIYFILAQMENSIHQISYFKAEVFEEIKEKMLIRKGNRD